ncbi:hypothetical protein ACFW9L_16255 [Streptomyces sp. NPDC059517]|uniref:hypothetical protein n=1 Tax=Streptomyces sp. NPDC059517 TaxID=3346855 RepID=UPI0036AB8107
MGRRRIAKGERHEPSAEIKVPAIAELPGSNAVAAVIIVVCALVGAIVILLIVPGAIEALGAATTIAASGFTLAAKIGVPRGQ